MSSGPSKSSRPGHPPRGVTRSPGPSQAKCPGESPPLVDNKLSRLLSIQQSAQAARLYDCIKNLVLDQAGQMPGFSKEPVTPGPTKQSLARSSVKAPFIPIPPKTPFVPISPKPPAFRGTIDTGFAASRTTPSGSSTSKKTFSAWISDNEEEGEDKESRCEGSEELGKTSSPEGEGGPAEGGKVAMPNRGALPAGSAAAAQMPAPGHGACGPQPSGSKPGPVGPTPSGPMAPVGPMPSGHKPGPAAPVSSPSSAPAAEGPSAPTGSQRPGRVDKTGWGGIWSFLFPFWPIGGPFWGPFWPLPVSWPSPRIPKPDFPSAGGPVRPKPRPGPIGPLGPGRPPRPAGGGGRPAPARPGGVLPPWPWFPLKPGGLPGLEGGGRPGPARPGGVLPPWPWFPSKPGGLPGLEGGGLPGPARPGGILPPWPLLPPGPGGTIPLPVRPGRPPRPDNIGFPILPVAIEPRPTLPTQPGRPPLAPPLLPINPIKPPIGGGILEFPPVGGPIKPPTIGGGICDPFWPIAGGKPPFSPPSLPSKPPMGGGILEFPPVGGPIKPPIGGGVLEFPPVGGPVKPPTIGGGICDPFWPIAGGKPPFSPPLLPSKPPIGGGVLEFPPVGGPVKPPTIGGGICDPFWPIAGGKPPFSLPSLPSKPPMGGGVLEFPPAGSPIKPPTIGGGILKPIQPIVIGKPPLLSPSKPINPIKLPPSGVLEFPPAEIPTRPPSIGGGVLKPLPPTVIGKPPVRPPHSPVRPPINKGVPEFPSPAVEKPRSIKFPIGAERRPDPPVSAPTKLQGTRSYESAKSTEPLAPRPSLSSPAEQSEVERRAGGKERAPVKPETQKDLVPTKSQPTDPTDGALSEPRPKSVEQPPRKMEYSSKSVPMPAQAIEESSTAVAPSDHPDSDGSRNSAGTARVATELEKTAAAVSSESVPLAPVETVAPKPIGASNNESEVLPVQTALPLETTTSNPPTSGATNLAETNSESSRAEAASPVATPLTEETQANPSPSREIQQVSWAVRAEDSHMLRPAEPPDPGPRPHDTPPVNESRPTVNESYEGSKWRDYSGDNVDINYTVPGLVWGKRGEADASDSGPELRRRDWQLSSGGQFGFGPSEVGAVPERQISSQTASESDDSAVKRVSETKEAAQTSQSSEQSLKGRGGRQRTARYSSTAKKKKSSGGGKARVRVYRVPPKETEETEKLADGGVAGNCATCGTALPAAQAGNCPVCAQSGEDVILLTQTNYRFAGDKFFATADAVSATQEVKEIFAGETTLPLVNLRYWPKIPGHRDVLQIVREGESSQAS